MEGKKISFGFTKTKKVEKPVLVEKRDYIECLEEKSIKVVGGEAVEEEKAPLVIAMKPNTLITAERLKQIAEEVEKAVGKIPAPGDHVYKEVNDTPLVENETLDQMAERELLNEAKKVKKVDQPELTVVVPSQPTLDGQKESTLEDYDTIPVQEFGMAMLRGMGWSASKEQQLKYKQPELRPKGLGLGADKVVKENQKKNVSKDKDNENLSIIKNAYVKITTGKYAGCYGRVTGLDEDNGRVMVDISIKKETVSLSEFMMQPVSKSEFDKQSKVINADSYEEYKRNEQGQKASHNRESQRSNDRAASSSQRPNESKTKSNDSRSCKEYENSSNGKNKVKEQPHRSRSPSYDESKRRRHKKRYSSNDSLSSRSDSDRQRKHKSSKKRHSSDESDSSDDDHRKEKRKKSSSDKKRDIDKKRKGKKKKRDRDRSPNYKKHRK